MQGLRQIHEETRKSYNLAAEKYFEDFLETRRPYDFEIPVDRIYATGVKIARL